MAQAHDAPAQLPRASRHGKAINEIGADSQDKDSNAKQQQILESFRQQHGTERNRKQQQATQHQSGLRGNIEETIGEIPGEHRGGSRAFAQTDRKTNHVAANNRGKKKRAEETAEITLRAGSQIELRASGVDDHAPLQNANRVRAKIEKNDDDESRGRNFDNRGPKRGEREKMDEERQDG